jgi:hypothetical protein
MGVALCVQGLWEALGDKPTVTKPREFIKGRIFM